MYHMTLLHWIVVVLFIVIFLILSLFALKEKRLKIAFLMIFASFVLVILGTVFSLFTLDKYTKKAKLESIRYTNIPSNNSMKIRGVVKNIGSFDIGYCKLEVRVIDMFSKKIQKGSMFAPRTSFGEMFNENSGKIKNNFVSKTFKITNNLLPKETKKFLFSLTYPSYFQKPKLKYQLSCY